MRILIYSYNYHPEPIGIAPLMTELAEGLVRRGHDVRVVTAMPNYPERRVYPQYRGKFYCTEQCNGVQVQRSWVWIKPKPRLIDRVLLDASFVTTSLVQALRGPRPDIILLTAPPLPVSVPVALLGFLYSCPVVLNLQDILPEAAIQLGILKNKGIIRVFEALEQFAYRNATAISVITDKFTENLHSKGVRLSKMVCIPNWVDVRFIRPLSRDNNSFRSDNGLDNKFVVLYSGNIAHSQGIETVVKAAARLSHKSDIQVVIVGEQTALEQLRHRCEGEGMSLDNVSLLGFQPRETLPTMLAAANVSLIVQKRNVISFNMPSKTQVLMASGRPIVASIPNSGAAAEAMERAQAGLVVAPEDDEALANAVLDLYNNPKKAEDMGNNGRRYALDNYSFDQSLNRYEELFANLVADQSPVMRTQPIPRTADH